MSKSITTKTKSALIVSIFLWASAYVGIRAALNGYSPEALALLRYLIASLVMGIVYFRLPTRSALRMQDTLGLLFVGVFGIGVYNLTLNRGELSISSGMASFITSQSPIITVLFAILFLGEEVSLSRALGFLISVMGIALIAVGEVGGFKWDDSMYYILLATLASGCYSIMQKPFLKKYHVIEATTYVIWGGTLFLCWYFPQLSQEIRHAPFAATLSVIYLGVFPAAIGYIAWSYVLAEIPASRAVSYLYLMPFISTLMGWLFLGEVPMVVSVLGALLAMAGILLVNQSYRRLAINS